MLGMSFLKLSNADMKFAAWEITWRSYTIIKKLLTVKPIKQIDKHKFTQIALEKNSEIFIIYVTALEV